MRNPSILLAAALALPGCSDDPADVEEPPVVETHLIRDVDYIQNTCFYVDDPESFRGATEAGFEVYRTVTPQDLLLDPTILHFPGWAIPDSVGNGESLYDAAAFINVGNRPRPAQMERFRRLERGVDYELWTDAFMPVVIGIELFEPVPVAALRSVAIRYTNEWGTMIGGSYATYGVIDPATGQVVVPDSPADTLMLEMVKAPDPRPTGPFGSVWRLEVRNVYDLGFTDIDPASFTLVIEDVLTLRDNPRRPEGSTVPYLRIFGLDRTDASGTGPPDGKIDLGTGLVDLDRGRLTLPAVRGFAPRAESVAEWTDTLFEFSGQYEAQFQRAERIYDELLSPIAEAEVHQYLIRATVTTPPAP